MNSQLSTGRLKATLAQLAPLLAATRAREVIRPLPTVRKVDPSKLQLCLAAMRPHLEKARGRRKYNPWSMAALGYDEVRNCAVLGKLWDVGSVGPLAARFLAAYFDRIACQGGILPCLADLSKRYTVRTEHCPTGTQSERVDITIEGIDFLVGIEVKIRAAEGPEQLRRYCDVIASRAQGMGIPRTRQCVVFLAPYRTEVPDVLQSDWQDVAAAAKLVAQNSVPTEATPAWLIRCFGEHAQNL